MSDNPTKSYCCGHRRDENSSRFESVRHQNELGTYGWCCLEWHALSGDHWAADELTRRGKEIPEGYFRHLPPHIRDAALS